MAINYEEVLPHILVAMFSDPEARLKAEKRLGDYGKEHWHWVPPQVRVAILKLTFDNPGNLDQIVETACGDYRDVLFFAETPLSFQDWNLPEENPQKYADLVKADQENYENWIKDMMELSREWQST